MLMSIVYYRRYGLVWWGKLSEISQTKRQKLFNVTHVLNLKIQQTHSCFQNSEYNRKETDSQI